MHDTVLFSLERFLTDLATLLAIDSGTANVRGVNRVGTFFRERFRALGWSIREIDCGEKAETLLEIYNRPCERYDLTLMGHMDTVFPDGTAAKRPMRVTEGRAYGPGAADMKQGDLMMLYLAEEMAAADLKDVSVCMLLTPDEEIMSLYSAPHLREIAKRSDRILIMEAGWCDGCRCVSRNGRWAAKASFHGIAAHAGYLFSAPNASAILEAAHWITALMALRSEENGVTVNIGTVRGGSADNVVPESAELTFEARFLRPEDYAHLRSTVEGLLAAPSVPGVAATLSEERYFAPLLPTEKTRSFWKLAEEAANREGIPFGLRHRIGLSDANNIADCGAAILDSMGPAGQGGHGEQEYMLLESVEPTLRLCLAIVRAVSEEADG